MNEHRERPAHPGIGPDADRRVAEESYLVCDGCLRLADAAHLTARVQRLERDTRFRPIHIHILFVAEAPPMDAEDSISAGHDALLDALGITGSPEERLAEFQKRGMYLAYLMECPLRAAGLAPGADTLEARPEALAQRFAATFALRVRFSYRPKRVALLTAAAGPLAKEFSSAGMTELLLSEGGPLAVPAGGDRSGALAFRSLIEGALAGAAASARG